MKALVHWILIGILALLLAGCQSMSTEDGTTQYNNQQLNENNEIIDKELKTKETIYNKTIANDENSQNNEINDENTPWQGFQKPADGELRDQLTELQYHVTQEEGTEEPFNNEYWDSKEEGIYVDIVSGEPLFSSIDKFDSGTGWPSFTKPLAQENIVEHSDYKLMVRRTEIRSRYANSHLGHVFRDGPAPTYLRYCMNSAALRFVPKEELEEQGYGEFSYLFE